MTSLFKTSVCLLFGIYLVGCAGKPERVYKLEHDVEPSGGFEATDLPLLTPKWEPLSPQGNKSPYVVRGIEYQIMPFDSDYVEEGYASWYGLKFHNELTSNGERYNMYSFSAAHKSLPLPSYVNVTNLDNGTSLVVRVNDRGPFHSNRIIDLSYAAAIKLGFKDRGTARVRVERIKIAPPIVQQRSGVASEIEDNDAPNRKSFVDRIAPFVQVAAFSSHDLAEAMRERVALLEPDVDAFLAEVEGANGLVYRVRLGPFSSTQDANLVVKKLIANDVGRPQVISRSINARGN